MSGHLTIDYTNRLCTPPCTAGFSNSRCFHAFMIPDLRIPIKDLGEGLARLRPLRGRNFLSLMAREQCFQAYD